MSNDNEPRHNPDAKYQDEILCKCCGENPVVWVKDDTILWGNVRKGHTPTDRCETCTNWQPEASSDGLLASISITFARHGFDPRIGGEYEALIRDIAATQQPSAHEQRNG